MRVLSAVMLVGCWSNSPATHTPNVCPAHAPTLHASEPARLHCDQATMMLDGDTLRAIDPDDEPTGEPSEVRWRGALGPGVDGVLAWFGGCGNLGECVVGVFASCGDGRFVAVTNVDYVYDLAIGPPLDGWATVVAQYRADAGTPPDSVRMTFDRTSGRYR